MHVDVSHSPAGRPNQLLALSDCQPSSAKPSAFARLAARPPPFSSCETGNNNPLYGRAAPAFVGPFASPADPTPGEVSHPGRGCGPPVGHSGHSVCLQYPTNIHNPLQDESPTERCKNQLFGVQSSMRQPVVRPLATVCYFEPLELAATRSCYYSIWACIKIGRPPPRPPGRIDKHPLVGCPSMKFAHISYMSQTSWLADQPLSNRVFESFGTNGHNHCGTGNSTGVTRRTFELKSF